MVGAELVLDLEPAHGTWFTKLDDMVPQYYSRLAKGLASMYQCEAHGVARKPFCSTILLIRVGILHGPLLDIKALQNGPASPCLL